MLIDLVGRTGDDVQILAISDAVELNRGLLKRPGQLVDLEILSRYNIMDFYSGIITGEQVNLEERPTINLIDRSSCIYDDFQTWCREVVWWGNKKGAYLYANKTVEKQLAGHF